jgi:hypothetical protein
VQAKLLWKYIIALLVGIAFAYSLTWLTVISANLMPALGPYKWTREHIEISMFFANIYAFILPLGIMSLLIGYLLSKLLKTSATVILVLAALPPISFYLFPYLYLPLSDFDMLHWFLEAPKVFVIAGGITYMIKRGSTEE